MVLADSTPRKVMTHGLFTLPLSLSMDPLHNKGQMGTRFVSFTKWPSVTRIIYNNVHIIFEWGECLGSGEFFHMQLIPLGSA